MTELKIGGSNVGKIMFNGQEFGGATKLEKGTIIYTATSNGRLGIKNIHLLSTTKNWSNINGININVSYASGSSIGNRDIPSDDLKNLDIKKNYKLNNDTVTVSRTIVDGEYRLNVSVDSDDLYRFKIIAI